jgi:hypothetical protein
MGATGKPAARAGIEGRREGSTIRLLPSHPPAMTEPTIPRQSHPGARGVRLRRALVRCALAAPLALASPASPAQGNVVTLYGGARAGGDLVDQNDSDATVTLKSGGAGALSFDWMLADGRQAQIFYSFQHSGLPASVVKGTGDIGLGVSYLQVGGRIFFDGYYTTNGSYLVGGLGVTYFKPDADGLSSEVRPSGTLGLGYQWMLGRQVALRAEMRGYVTLINSSGGFLCSGGCVASIRGDTLTQVEGLLGLSYGF